MTSGRRVDALLLRCECTGQATLSRHAKKVSAFFARLEVTRCVKAAGIVPDSCSIDYSKDMDGPQKGRSSGRDPPNIAILVRYWRSGRQQRFLLENVETRQTQAFTSFEALAQALHDILAEVDGPYRVDKDQA